MIADKIRSSLRGPARDASLAALRAVNQGNDHACPICGNSFGRFLRRGCNLMCVGCRSFARHRLMLLYLRRETRLLDEPARILHLAPEPSLYPVLAATPWLEYVTLDLEPGPFVEVQADAQALPFGAGSFDALLCSHVLEHVDDDLAAAREFARVLRPGGVALIQVPVDDTLTETYETDATTPSERLAAYGQDDHVRLYAPDVVDRLRRAFADVERIDYSRHFTAEETWRLGLRDPTGHRHGEDIYVCTA